ncbi:MAG: 16S rRNA (cytidine(1402)-2'-O)-methyltransferase [Zoogloea sp.]|nr:16S rRNA (cytidine(1402)-2'-O)-methyltransferase [Zoogloea sp.]
MHSALPDVSTVSPLSKTPSLYVVATPMGNLQDISLRGLAVLKSVAAVACEDTRHSQRLLEAFGIKTKLVALHEHNEQVAVGQVIKMLEAGQHVALITDAGTPAVSDPGARAVARVPGACAAIAALSASGLADGHFHFHGFLPVKSAARKAMLETLRSVPGTLVFYEAPHRIGETLDDLAATLEPVREIVVAREITKMFEQIVRMPIADAPAWLAADPNRSRGEFVLLVSAAPPTEGLSPETERVLGLLLAELPVKQAAKLAAAITGASKNDLYERALALKAAAE